MIASAAARSHATAVMRAVTKQRGMGALAPHIQRSWNRCLQQYGIQPGTRRDTLVLPERRLRERQQQLATLLDIARPEMESLYESIAGSGYAVTLADADGTIVGTVLDPGLGPEFRRIGMALGARWDEPCEGTNGIGTCLIEQAPTTVHHGEHFRDCNIRLSCAGAPILDARGKAFAVLCASSANPAETQAIRRHTIALVGMSASLVSRRCFLAEFADAWILRFHSRPEFVGLLQEALVAIDDGGRILALGESALLLLGDGPREGLVGHPIETLFHFDADTMHRRGAHAAATIWPIRDVARGRRFYARLRPPREPHRASPAARSHDVGVGHAPGDPRMRSNLASGQQLLARQVPILLHGATGTGKDLFARTLHAHSPWADRPFTTVNCAAIPERVFDRRLSGAMEGTRARDHEHPLTGNVPMPGGTLFLDEIGDLSLAQQARLVRALEARRHGQVAPGRQPAPDSYVISASHRDLSELVAAGEFRADLYYRLAGATLELPALKDRADKDELISALLREESASGAPVDISANARRHLLRYDWPGNVRQLRNVLRTAAVLCSGSVIRLSNLPQEIVEPGPQGVPPGAVAVPTATVASALQDAECDALARVLSQFDWNITHAAHALAVSRNTLYRKLRKHGIAPPARG